MRAPPAAQAAPVDAGLAGRVATLEENMRRMAAAYKALATDHAKLKASTKGAVGQLVGNVREIVGHLRGIAARVGYQLVSQAAQTVVQAQPQAPRVAPAAAAPVAPVAPAAPAQESAESAVDAAVNELFYGGDADELFYSGGEGE